MIAVINTDGLIDDEGNFLGVINIVDALVVLLIIAVGVAGLALVLGGQSTTTQPTSYATVVFEPLPDGTKQLVGQNDTIERVGGDGGFTVTDVYRTFGPNGSVITVGQLAVTPNEDNSRLRAGERYQFVAETYAANGTVRSISNRPTLRVSQTDTRLSAVVPEATISRIGQGDTLDIDNETIGTLQSTTAYPVGDGSSYRLTMAMSLQTIQLNGQPTFATKSVRPDTTVPLRFGSATVEGTVQTVGDVEPVGEMTNTTVRVAWENVAPERAATLETGLSERHPGSDATIVDLSSEPATVVLETESGELVSATHPENRDVTLTLDAETREVGQRTYFHGQSLRVGGTVTLDFGRVIVRGTIVGFE